MTRLLMVDAIIAKKGEGHNGTFVLVAFVHVPAAPQAEKSTIRAERGLQIGLHPFFERRLMSALLLSFAFSATAEQVITNVYLMTDAPRPSALFDETLRPAR